MIHIESSGVGSLVVRRSGLETLKAVWEEKGWSPFGERGTEVGYGDDLVTIEFGSGDPLGEMDEVLAEMGIEDLAHRGL